MSVNKTIYKRVASVIYLAAGTQGDLPWRHLVDPLRLFLDIHFHYKTTMSGVSHRDSSGKL